MNDSDSGIKNSSFYEQLSNKELLKKLLLKFYRNTNNCSTHVDCLYNLLVSDKYHASRLKGHPVEKQQKGRYRLICVAPAYDRVIQKATLTLIYKLLLPLIQNGVSYCGTTTRSAKKYVAIMDEDEESYDTYNSREAIKKVVEHVRNRNFYYFKSDISKFYDNIPKRRVYNKIVRLLEANTKDTSLNQIIKEIIFFKLSNLVELESDIRVNSNLPKKYVGIPQGSPLSQLFSNIYLIDFDTKMKEMFGDRFIRYIDDFVVLCKTRTELKQAKNLSIKYLNRLGLSLDPIKTLPQNLKSKDFVFLGIKISNLGLLPKEDNKEMKKWVYKVLDFNEKQYFSKGKYIGNERAINKMNDRIRGKSEYLKYYHSKNIFHSINQQILKAKKKDKRYTNLQEINISRVRSIIEFKEWSSIFSNV